MGCFSFLCKKCNKGIWSSSFNGDECILFLLDKGKVVEVMRGRYDSYGRVFPEGGYHQLRVPAFSELDKHDIEQKKKGILIWEYKHWHGICDMQFGPDATSGIAAFHKECYDNIEPKERSKDDPNQGWGE